MGEQFWIDSEELRAVAPEFDRIGSEAAAILRRLRDIVDATGEPWGADDTGRAFAETYLPDERRALSDLDELTRVLQRSGDDLRTVTATFEKQDLASARQIMEAGPGAPPAPVNRGPYLPATDDIPAHIPLSTGAPATSSPQNSPEPPYRQRPVSPAAHDDEPARPSGHRPDYSSIRPPRTVPADTAIAGTPAVAASRPTTSSSAPTPRMNTDHTGIGLPDRSTTPWSGDDPVGRTTRPGPGNDPTGRTATSRPGNGATPPTTLADPGKPSPWSTPTTDRAPRISAPRSSDIPPRIPARPGVRPRNRSAEPARASSPESVESPAARLAGELAERHNVRAFGFDTPGVPDEVLTELVAAVDDLLPRYPALHLYAIGIGELPDRSVARLEGDTRSPRITLATRAATDPEYLRQAINAEEEAGFLAPGCAERPVYSSIVRELGTALDAAGRFRARADAQRALLAAYLARADPYEKRSLHRTVSGFRHWRSQLCGRSFRDGRFDPAAALSEAFTGIVMAPDRATAPMLALYRLLVSTATGLPAVPGHSRPLTELEQRTARWSAPKRRR